MTDRIDKLVATRDAAYGGFADTSRVCVAILEWLRGPTPHEIAPVENACFMVAAKASRMLIGGDLGDSPDDIDGYMRVCRQVLHDWHPHDAEPLDAMEVIEMLTALPPDAASQLVNRLALMRRAASCDDAGAIAQLLETV